MSSLNEIHHRVLEKYARAIVHMRRQIDAMRFGLMFGAGLNKSFGIPDWGDLVERIAADPEVGGEELLSQVSPRESLPYKTEMLYGHFRKKCYDAEDEKKYHTRPFDYRIAGNWLRIIRKHLYAGAPNNFKEALKTHPYLTTFLPLIRGCQLTVSYNFDDFIERALAETHTEKDESRGYEMVTNPWMQFRRKNAIIYHPNGVVPFEPMEMPSDRIIFSESSYAEQMIGISSGDNAGLLNHLSKNTCLLVGLSLADETLRSLLAQSARSNPGNYHYYISYAENGTPISKQHQYAVEQANFKVYNLRTLFLTQKEIVALVQLLQCSDDDLRDLADHSPKIDLAYRFYITGALGAGKSTTINYFRNLVVYDEWLEPRIPELAKDWKTLTAGEEEKVSEWIADQFRLKNNHLRHKDIGIFFLDRGPLDPLGFTKAEEWPAKAERLLSNICSGANWKVVPGVVIFLSGDGWELSTRLALTDRADYTPEKLERMEEDLLVAYKFPKFMKIVDTRGMSAGEVTRRVAEIIHLESYNACNLHERLLDIKEGKI